MATLIELCESHAIVEIDPGLGPADLKWRCLYGTPDFTRWLEEVLPTYPEDHIHADLSPLEQVAACMMEYVLGEAFSTDRRFKKLKRTPSLDVWEMKTDDIRIFGWVPKKDAFVCCFGDLATDVKLQGKYGRYMAQTTRVRQLLALDEPKFIGSEEYQDVISTKN